MGGTLSAAANPAAPSGRLGSCSHFLPLLLARAQHASALGLHKRGGGRRPGRPVWSLSLAGHSDAVMGHGCASTRGAEQNPGSMCSADGRAWRFALSRTESGKAVGLKQSSCSVSVITSSNQQLPSPAAGPCHTAAPRRGLEHKA